VWNLWLDPRELETEASRYWWLCLIAGVSWLAVSLIVFRFDWLTVLAIGILFGSIAIAAGVMEILVAAGVATRGWKILHYLAGFAFIVIGIISFLTPGNTFVALAALVSFFFAIGGAFDIVTALATRERFELWWLQLIAGVAEVALAFWAAGYWNRSVVLLVAWIGASTMFRGIVMILLGFKLAALREGERVPVHAARAA
jgi:uncharacterized membrane protein HdeD (DUF308 family)